MQAELVPNSSSVLLLHIYMYLLNELNFGGVERFAFNCKKTDSVE